MFACQRATSRQRTPSQRAQHSWPASIHQKSLQRCPEPRFRLAALAEAERVILTQFSNRDLDATLSLLAEAGATKRVPPPEVEGALLRLEQLCAEGAVPANIHPNISGRWYLVFGTATKVRAFQYIPVREELVVDLSGQRIALESTVGPFSFFIKGVVSAWRPEERGLDFQFNAVEVRLGGKQIWQTAPKTKPKTYTWFYVSDKLSAARSSAGGMALLIRL